MNRKFFFLVSSVLLILLLSVAIATAQGPVGTAFSYQGRLTDGGNPANGDYDFEFKLYDAATGGNQIGSTFVSTGTLVTDGLFAIDLDFGAVFTGEARYLEIAVRPAGSSDSYNTLTPRQTLNPAPYALGLRPGTRIVGDRKNQNTLYVFNLATSGRSRAIVGETRANEGRGVSGWASATSGVNYGVTGGSWSTEGRGVAGRAYAASGSTYGVLGESDSPDGSGVYATNYANGIDLIVGGTADGSVFDDGIISSEPGLPKSQLMLFSNNDVSVHLDRDSNTTSSFVIFNGDDADVFRVGENGNVNVSGNLSKGSGSFKIDHPLDPANKYLYHSFVESPDMMNVYNGNAALDANGEAWVALPDWFEALNKDFRYQLTPVGGPGPGLYIAEKVRDNRFKIAGGEPGLEVSWQVTGIRHDAYAEAYRIPVEEMKPVEERGAYLHPHAHGIPETTGLAHKETQEKEQPEVEALEAPLDLLPELPPFSNEPAGN